MYMYFIPKPTKDMPPKIKNLLSDELFDLIKKRKFEVMGGESTQWIYLEDCVSRGTITPMEAYDCCEIGYVPDYLGNRESYYQQI